MLQTEPVLSGMSERHQGGQNPIRVLKHLGHMVVAAVVLAACGTPDPSYMNTSYDAKAFPANGKAVVIMASVAETKGGWLTGPEPLRIYDVNSTWVNISPASSTAPNKFDAGFRKPRVYMVDPGRYIMTNYTSDKIGNTIYTGRGIALDTQSGKMVVPTFSVGAGDVIYVGSQVFRFTVPGRRYEIIDDEQELAEEVTDNPKYAAIRDKIETQLIRIGVLPPGTPGVDG